MNNNNNHHPHNNNNNNNNNNTLIFIQDNPVSVINTVIKGGPVIKKKISCSHGDNVSGNL